MGQCIEGVWTTQSHFPTNEEGAFVRAATSFHGRVAADGSTQYPVEAGRYHLYVSYACPWAHRTLIAREMLGLQDAISISVSHPLMLENGWVFSDGKAEVPDDVNEADYLWQIYVAADPKYTGRATVPVLWDKKTSTIVNNESREILRMLTTEFRELWKAPAELAPADLTAQIDEMITANYEPINNGVYRSGFARRQEAYEEAVTELFETLEAREELLGRQRYLCGDRFTEADICLFTTLVRFDLVYYGHFKCNKRHIFQYPNLWGFVRDVYQLPGVAQTCRFDHIKQHYYGSHESVNPTGVVPVGPELDFDAPHDRARLG